MLGYFVAFAIFSTAPLILIQPHVGILVWYWIGFMNPHQLSWGPATQGGFAFKMGLLTLIAWLISRESKKIPLTAVTVLFGIFSIWVTLTTLDAHLPDRAWEDWERTIKIFLMAFATIGLITSRERIHALIWIMVVCLGYFGILNGLKTIMSGAGGIVWGPPKSFIEDNNQLAMALLMTLPFMRYLQLQSEIKWVRMGLLGAMALTVFAIIGSFSRGAFLGSLVVLLALVWRSRYRAQIGAVVLAVALTGVWFVPDRWIERMETIANYEEDGSAMGRIRDWTFNYRLALENPVLGGGFNAYMDEQLFFRLIPDAPKNANAHSIYFEVLGEHGFVGLAIFLALAVCVWRTFSRIRRQTRDRPDLHWAFDLASMGQASLLAYFSAGTFLNLAFFDYYYTILAVAVVSNAVVQRALDESPASSQPTLDGERAASKRALRYAPGRRDMPSMSRR